ncbi:MAG: hypothetical protein GY820_17950 [Gammaproteobacteria bacterium]|nr:hypothetical protein [Gammaproteobacteria bacterium]
MQTTQALHDYSMKAFSQIGIDQEIAATLSRISEATRDDELEGEQLENVGFALKRVPQRTRFSTKVKSYLSEKFREGDRLHRKYDPRDIAKEMRTVKSANGDPMFTTEECLSWQQIARFWSQNARRI